MRTRLAILLAPCLLFVSSLALAACGGSDESAEDQVEEAIVTSVTSNDPGKCSELETAAFRHQTSGLDGDEALDECEKEASETSDDPDKVTVTSIEVDGAEASADVAFVGGGFDGQTVAVTLVEEDDQWKMDRVDGFAKFDGNALAQTLEEQFEKVSDEITPEQISCIGDALREAQQSEVEELLLEGDDQQFVEFAEACE